MSDFQKYLNKKRLILFPCEKCKVKPTLSHIATTDCMSYPYTFVKIRCDNCGVVIESKPIYDGRTPEPDKLYEDLDRIVSIWNYGNNTNELR